MPSSLIRGFNTLGIFFLKIVNIIDLTGAGDLFAAGFLNEYIKKKEINECLKQGTELSSKIIQILGARI